MNHRNEFITWYFNEFVDDPHFKVMLSVSENSPWHREQNTGIHTNMVVGQYLANTDHVTWFNDGRKYDDGRQFLMGAFAAAFHDVGKPHSMQIKHREDRGEYRAFNGHEKVSARLWEDWAVKHWAMLRERFNFTANEIFTVGWMIENHLPWGLKKADKRNNLALTVARLGIRNAFPALLMADTTGRISDDMITKIQNAENWCDEFFDLVQNQGLLYFSSGEEYQRGDRPQIIMPIAPSGAGKSTVFTKQYQHRGVAHFSLDEERLLFAGENNDYLGWDTKKIYQHAWEWCNENKAEFNQRWQAKFIDIVKRRLDVYVDNTNLSRKARNFFLTHAHGRDYWKTAILMPIDELTVINRQPRRHDKELHASSVEQQYRALQLPWYGDFDEIIVQDII